MKNSKVLKIILMVLLSGIIAITMSNVSIVRAADEFDWNDLDGDTSSNTTEENTTDNNFATTPTETNNTTNDTTNNAVDNTGFYSTTNSSANNTTNNSSVNKSSTTSNSNSLAKTGIKDSKGTVSLIVVVCGIVAVYSLKKVRDYKDM